MEKFIDRFERVRENTIESFEWRKKHRGEDPLYWDTYMGDHRLLAIAAYVLDHDVKGFRDHMGKVMDYTFKSFEKCKEQGRGVFINSICYLNIFDILSYGDSSLAVKAMEYAEDVDLKKERPLASVKYINLAFRLLIIGRKAKAEDLDEMVTLHEKKKKSFMGYALCFKAIYDQDIQAFEEGFKVLMKGYKTSLSSLIGFQTDETLAMWPLGVVNLARMKGLDVKPEHPLVPQELMIEKVGDLC